MDQEISVIAIVSWFYFFHKPQTHIYL